MTVLGPEGEEGDLQEEGLRESHSGFGSARVPTVSQALSRALKARKRAPRAGALASGGGDGESLDGHAVPCLPGAESGVTRIVEPPQPSHLAGGEAMEGEEQLRENHPERAQGPRPGRKGHCPALLPALLPWLTLPCPCGRATPQPGRAPATSNQVCVSWFRVKEAWPLLLSGRGGPGSPGHKPAHHLPTAVPSRPAQPLRRPGSRGDLPARARALGASGQ